MRKVMKSPDRITGTLTRCIGHEKRRDWRLSVLAIIATVIPSVASIVTRHVKGNVLSNHGFIMGFVRFSQVFTVKTSSSGALIKLGHRLFPTWTARKNAAQEHIRLPCGVR
jgi:cytochrome c oxidase subunit II